MPKPSLRRKANKRVARHRHRVVTKGKRRVELVVPASDVQLMKSLATVLREDGAAAADARRALRSLAPSSRSDEPKTGRDLIEFFRNSPLFGEHALFARDS